MLPAGQWLLQTVHPQARAPAFPAGAGGSRHRGGWAQASPLTGAQDIQDVGEEVVVLCLRHGGPQLLGLQKLGHQDAQAMLVGELGCEDLENGLGRERACVRRPPRGPGPGAGD